MTDESEQESVAQEQADETKKKFREALERKKQQGDNRIAAPGSESTIHGVHGKAGGKRQFRRKSV
jgi:membrane-associated protein